MGERERRHAVRRVRRDLRHVPAVPLGDAHALSPLAREDPHQPAAARRDAQVGRAAHRVRRAAARGAREGGVPDRGRVSARSRFAGSAASRSDDAADRRLLRVSERGDRQAHRRAAAAQEDGASHQGAEGRPRRVGKARLSGRADAGRPRRVPLLRAAR